MALTLGLGAAGLAAGAAFAGAVTLAGVAGLALAGRRRGRGRGRGRGFRGGRRRFGRDVSGAEESEAVERVMSLIREEDVSGCARRMTCELGGREKVTLTEEERAILDLVGPSVAPGEGVLPGGALGEFRAARGVGEAGGDCTLAYPTCPSNGAMVLDAVIAYLP